MITIQGKWKESFLSEMCLIHLAQFPNHLYLENRTFLSSVVLSLESDLVLVFSHYFALLRSLGVSWFRFDLNLT